MPNILFRADAEESIGVGDLMSLIYLSHEFRKNSWNCFFAIRDYEPALRITKKRNLPNVNLIPCDTSVADEILFIKKLCRDSSIDCLFMEVTKNSLREYGALGRPAAIKACINFDGVITEDFDVVVNWCVDLSGNVYRNYRESNVKFILGFENAVLPDYFDWEKISTRTYGKDVKNILVAMGGVDEFDLTGKIAKSLSEQTDGYDIRIIIGPGYARGEELTRFCDKKNKRAVVKYNVNNMLEDYLWADLAFSAGGLTSSELVATKTPAILVASCDHQVNRCEYYSTKKWAYYAGYYKNFDEKSVARSLEDLITNISLLRNSLCQSDFRGGSKRIYESICSCR